MLKPRTVRSILIRLFWVIALCSPALWCPPAAAQTDPVADWMDGMTTLEKVGQLFVVAFWGRNPSPPSRAGRLIQQYKIGGVVLITSNLNLVNQGPDTLSDVVRLNHTLQEMALDEAASGIPLWIAIDHEGDGYPYTRLTGGTTPLPSPMAVGATWDTQAAENVGEIVGRELSTLGINMLLGPVVDVLDDPRPSNQGDIGTRVFGGDPYWVGEMGRAYIRGVHSGGEGKLLTVAKHFPGHGGSDRLPDDEIATVDKSLQELKRVELAPFFAITNSEDPDGLGQTDGLMSSHIRYRGFYGDIRQFTKPISFDAESMQALLSLPEIAPWREDGLMVSDSLGVRAVRKYFDPQLRDFPHRQIAREAFLAGNDLLLLSEFALAFSWEQQYDNIVEVIEYFRETYDRDPSFAARVDQSVERILRHKLALYPDFDPETVLSPLEEPPQIDTSESLAVVEAIARQAVTVLQPTADSLPAAPRRDEDILIFAEERPIRECFDDLPECEPQPLLPLQSVEQAILDLYGPEGTEQIDPARIHTRSYTQLKAFLTQRQGEDTATLVEEAEWIVFAMLDPNPGYANSDALQLFLAQNAHQIYDAQVVVLAYTAPYYLDTTEISKLAAYYVLYGKTQPFVETSVRTLFGEVRPMGHAPVSIGGTYYDLNVQLAPEPTQRISLQRIAPDAGSALVPATLRVRTNTITDRNGNPVPDGTRVNLIARNAQSAQIYDTVEVLTYGGIAEGALTLSQPGRVAVVASSGETNEGFALYFEALQMPTPSPTPAPPTATPTREPTATPTSTPTTAPAPTSQTTPTAVPTPAPPTAAERLDALLSAWQAAPGDLLGAIVGMVLAAAGGVVLGRRRRPSRLAQTLLAAWVGGFAGYLVFGWLPLSQWSAFPTWIVSGIFALVGGAILVVVSRRISSGHPARGP